MGRIAMKISHLRFLLLSSVLPAVLAQTSILPPGPTNTFPNCAFSCPNLQAAATQCDGTQSRLQSDINWCFCNDENISAMRTNPSSICGTTCTAQSDLNELQAWYVGFCGSSAQPAGGNAVVTTTTTIPPQAGGTGTTLTTIQTTGTNAASAATITSASGSSLSTQNQPTGWWPTHWRWIIMAAVVVIGFGLLAVIAVYVKRRYRRKKDALRTPPQVPPSAQMSQNSLAPPTVGTRTGTMQSSRTRSGTLRSNRGDMREVWGPHQHMAATNGYDYTPSTLAERDAIENIRTPSRTPSRTATLTSQAARMDSRKGKDREHPIDEEALAGAIASKMEEDDKAKGKKVRKAPEVKIDEKGAATAAAAANASLRQHRSRLNPSDRSLS